MGAKILEEYDEKLYALTGQTGCKRIEIRHDKLTYGEVQKEIIETLGNIGAFNSKECYSKFAVGPARLNLFNSNSLQSLAGAVSTPGMHGNSSINQLSDLISCRISGLIL